MTTKTRKKKTKNSVKKGKNATKRGGQGKNEKRSQNEPKKKRKKVENIV